MGDTGNIKLEYTSAATDSATLNILFRITDPGTDGFAFSDTNTMILDADAAAADGGPFFTDTDGTFDSTNGVAYTIATSGTTDKTGIFSKLGSSAAVATAVHQLQYFPAALGTSKETLVIKTTTMHKGAYTVYCYANDQHNDATTSVTVTDRTSSSAAKGISAIAGILFAMLY